MTVEGVVVRAHGKFFIVHSHGKNITCKIRGRLRFKSHSVTPVAVGDDVIVTLESDGIGVIEQVEERRTVFFRAAKGLDSKRQTIAANLDQLAVVVSTKNPGLKPGLIDRFLIVAAIGEMCPVIIINKVDLGEPAILAELVKGYANIDIPVLLTSAITGEGCHAVLNVLREHRTILAGHSGVGKTALINRLIPGLNLMVGEVSDSSNRGIHTTSLVELFELPTGGFVADSPGIKVLGLWKVEKADLAGYYPEMQKFLGECRFTGCSHTHEPDCAIKEAVRGGNIPRFRYENYVAILDSL
ncbi:MAG: ribosome small subunit-dependent GTPase A [candidate division Zixibacteria bacterium]|nr:ribosome small subunit-dependent GTPase A [candidate division Zixibacteria bacterium]